MRPEPTAGTICRNCGRRIVPDDMGGWLHPIGAVRVRRACAVTLAEPMDEGDVA